MVNIGRFNTSLPIFFLVLPVHYLCITVVLCITYYLAIYRQYIELLAASSSVMSARLSLVTVLGCWWFMLIR